MNDLAQRAQANADKARSRFESTHVARERWSVTRPNEAPIEVFFCPPQTHADIMKNWAAYRHCGVLPL